MPTARPNAASPRPFAAAPDPAQYFPGHAVEEARQRVERSVIRGEGPVLVMGATGVGKTMLLEVVAQQLRDQFQPVLLAGGQVCTRRGLLQMILFQLRLPYREMDESELRLSLMDYLQPQAGNPQRILLLVDGADALPPRLLEELRALTDLSSGGQLLVSMVLAGNSRLEEHFAEPSLELFSQRVSARCYLSPFGREETFQYVRAQAATTGQEPDALFSADGLEALFSATDGVPRLINQLGDQLMWMVAETGYAPLDGLIVQQAWSEIQQLPAPWNTREREPAGEAVEFGELPSDENDMMEIVFEDASELAEYDDDLPASIPISAQPGFASPAKSEQLLGEVKVDVTEHVLEQLQTEEDMPVEDCLKPVDDQTSRNPFEETFESEEVVLDRYSVFESLLLAEAPRVTNVADTVFAKQLLEVEVSGTVVSETCSSEPVQLEEPLPEMLETSLAVGPPGEILVIEDTEGPQTAIVNGNKFRQLFSDLEQATEKPLFG